MIKRTYKTVKNIYFRFSPGLFWNTYSLLTRRLGIESLYVILSYDCDTPKDAEASMELFAWLRKQNIPATFAVPGVQLEIGERQYKSLRDSGAQFINHGGSDHTEWRDGRYWSKTFYSKMNDKDVKSDIEVGHEIFKKILSKEPDGFRAPHFGHYQEPKQLTLIYQTLKDLGTYRFSTTTVPSAALHNGPVYSVGGLIEIPVTGSFYWPLRIFDSWRYRQNKINRNVENQYAAEFKKTIDAVRKREISAVLNYYADPSHVWKNLSYYQAIEYVKDKGAIFIDYDELLKQVNLKDN